MTLLGLFARTGIFKELRKTLKHDVHEATDPLRRDVKTLTKRMDRIAEQVDEIAQQVETLGRQADKANSERRKQHARELTKLADVLEQQQRDRVAQLPALLNTGRVVRHVKDAIAASPLFLNPFPHIVVDRLVPDDVYEVILEAIPPVSLFPTRDPIKQNLKVPMESGSTLSTRVWQFVDDAVVRQGVLAGTLEKFDEQLNKHYDLIFGPDFRERARAMPLEVSGGRLMLRRPGYHLGPHRDPKRTVATCLLYFARPGDPEEYGTQIFRVFDDKEASYTQTYYPEQEGRRCELVKLVPYRPNSMLVFLNSYGAHGADIPATASAALERYSCQFYIGPAGDVLNALVDGLPPERQAMWRNRDEVAAGY